MTFPLRAASALFAAAFCLAGPAHAECKYVKQTTLPIHYAAGSPLALVDGSINNAKAPMALDTGAYTTTLLSAQAERRGLRLRTRYQGVWNASTMLALQMGMDWGDPNAGMQLESTGAGVGKDVAAFMTNIKEFSIGPIKAPPGKLPVVDMLPDAPYDAIVGADVLLQSDLEIALAEDRVSFFRGLGCTDAFLAYWDPDAIVVPMEKTNLPQAVVAVVLNGKPALALLDTGTPRSFVLPKMAASVGVRETDAASKAGGDEPDNTWLAKFDTLAIGDATFASPYLYVSRNQMARPVPYQVVLGLDFMKSHRMLLANGQQKVYFSVERTSKAFTGQRASVNVENVGKPSTRR